MREIVIWWWEGRAMKTEGEEESFDKATTIGSERKRERQRETERESKHIYDFPAGLVFLTHIFWCFFIFLRPQNYISGIFLLPILPVFSTSFPCFQSELQKKKGITWYCWPLASVIIYISVALCVCAPRVLCTFHILYFYFNIEDM